jgi:WD40 repeat protein/predicted Ser/Thr protein kinase
MGVVYKARQRDLNRLVALKVLRRGAYASAEELARFRREARVLASLRHPNVVQVYDAGEHDGCPYLVLELVDGGTLAQHAGEALLAPSQVAVLVETLARAMHAAHTQGIVHRDLKPSNVLLAQDGTPKVTDFGLAKRVEAGRRLTQDYALLGTPSYMAPEQVEGKTDRITPTTDVYGLGAILYTLLTGRPPFQGATLLTLQQVRFKQPVRPRDLRHGVPQDLETICLRCLEKDPGRRYGSAAELADDVQRFRRGELISARCAAASARALRRPWGRRWLAGALAGAVMCVAVLSVVGVWRWARPSEGGATDRDIVAPPGTPAAGSPGGPVQVTGGDSAEARVPADRVILELLEVPETARVFLDGQDKGNQRRFELQVSQPGEYKTIELRVELPGANSPIVLPVLVRGGWQPVRMPLPKLAASRPDPADRWGGPIRPDTAILELLELPDGAKVFVDDREQRAQRRVELGSFKAGEWQTHELRVELPGAKEPFTRSVLLRGGWLARIPLPEQAGAARPELVVQTGHTGRVTSVAFNRDGSRILTGSSDKTANLWGAASGRKLRAFEGHVGQVLAVAFSPDAGQVLTGSEDGTAILWETADGRALTAFQGHKGWITSVAFSPDGKQVLTGSTDKMAILWDAASGRRLRAFEAHEGAVYGVAFSPDGKTVLTGSADRTALLWDMGDNTRPPRKFHGQHRDGIYTVAFNPKGTQIVTGSHDSTAILWDLEKGQPVQRFSHEGWVNAVAFSPDGKIVLTGSDDKTARLWDAGTGQPIGTSLAQGAEVKAVAFSPDGKQAITGAEDGTVVLWHAASGQKRRTFQGHSWLVDSVAFSRDGQVLARSHDGTAILWDAASGQKPRALPVRTGPGSAVAFSPDGKQVLTGADDGTAVLWDAATDRNLQKFQRHDSWVQAVAFSPDGRKVLTGSDDKTAILWDIASAQKVHLLNGHSRAVVAVAFSPKGHRAVTGSDDKTAIMWDADSGKQLHVLKGHGGGVQAVAFSLDGRRIVTGSQDSLAILWDAETGGKLRTFAGHTGRVNAVAFSPDGSQLLTGSDDGTAILWDAADGKILRAFRGHTAGVSTAAFSPEGTWVLTGSWDGTVRLWGLATGEEVARLLSLDGGSDWLVVTPEGLFDGSVGGRDKVSYRVGVGLNIVPVDRFFQDFYRTELLARIWRGERPLPTAQFGRSLPPILHIVSPLEGSLVETSEVKLEVEAVDQGGGVKGPWVMHNGARLLGPGSQERYGKTVRDHFTVSLIEGENRLEARAASEDGSFESEPASIVLRYEKSPSNPTFYVVAVGISNYKDHRYQLKYARADAERVAKLFYRRGEKTLYQHVDLTLLPDADATKDKISKAMQKVAQLAKAQDVVLLFMAGHGTMVGQRYYFIPYEFVTHPANRLEDDIRDQALPADVLGDFLSSGPALKRILILDTCASGGAVGLFRIGARGPFALRGEVERLNRAKGVYVMAAAPATEEAGEVEELGQGLLSYALLAGLKAVDKGPLKEKWAQPSEAGVVSVGDWFAFAADNGANLSVKYFGREQAVVTTTAGNNFPLLPLRDP